LFFLIFSIPDGANVVYRLSKQAITFLSSSIFIKRERAKSLSLDTGTSFSRLPKSLAEAIRHFLELPIPFQFTSIF
jgi:hypothetical protein